MRVEYQVVKETHSSRLPFISALSLVAVLNWRSPQPLNNQHRLDDRLMHMVEAVYLPRIHSAVVALRGPRLKTATYSDHRPAAQTGFMIFIHLVGLRSNMCSPNSRTLPAQTKLNS